MGRFSDEGSFVYGAPINATSGYVVLSFDELAINQVPHSIILKWDNGNFYECSKEGWLCAGLAVLNKHSEPSLLAVSRFGKTVQFSGTTKLTGLIDINLDEDSKISKRGPICCVRSIGDHIYAVGGDRQCYRMENYNLWYAMDKSCRPLPDETAIFGFQSVDGFSATEIYAVGWKGEIWQFDGAIWAKRDSPTNLLLTEVCCAGNGVVYAGGREGLLLHGRGDRWEIIDTKGLIDDIWSIRWFNHTLFISGMRGVYKLVDNVLETVDTGLTSFHKLSLSENILWAVGEKEIGTFNGLEWQKID